MAAEIPVEGITYQQLQVEKIPLTPHCPERDAALIPAANRAVVINPIRTCMPLGAMFAALGIHRCLPFVQGAQGCTTYVRYTFCRIFQEPASIANASFHEDAAVFGGRKNFVEGLRNLVVRYRPEAVAVVTTCSSEIIGDDMVSYIKIGRRRLAQDLGEEAARLPIILINTPSFAGAHIAGYDRAARAFIETLVQPAGRPHGRINIIPGMLFPGDIREIKHILGAFGVEGIVLFDIADVFDAPLAPPQHMPYYPPGGTRLGEVAAMADAAGTIALCPHEGGLGAQYLERRYGVPARLGPTPVGVRNTDRFVEQVAELSGRPVPQELLDERGRLLDFMADTLHHTMMRKVAIFGDPDLVLGLTSFACELGMEPVAVLSSVPSKMFEARLAEIVTEYGHRPQVFTAGDLFELEETLKKTKVDLIIGNSKGVDIAKELGVPLVRAGFFVYDRVGYPRRAIVGYRGAENLLMRIVNTLLDHRYPDDRTQQL